MLAIPHLSQVSSMAKIDSKEAQMKSKAGICFGFTSHNKHTSFLLSKEAQAAIMEERDGLSLTVFYKLELVDFLVCPSFEQGPHETFQCQPMNEDYYHEQNPCYDSNSFGFDQLQTPQFSVNHQPPQPMSMEALQAQEDLMKSIESFLKKFNRISFGKTPKVLLQAWDNFFEVKHAQSEEVQELLSKLVRDVKIISDEEPIRVLRVMMNYSEDDDTSILFPISNLLLLIIPILKFNHDVVEDIPVDDARTVKYSQFCHSSKFHNPQLHLEPNPKLID
ncbi:hypothetical protein Tco_1284463 [Tanacetum coccineum]